MIVFIPLEGERLELGGEQLEIGGKRRGIVFRLLVACLLSFR